jgi:hypothetical protein
LEAQRHQVEARRLFAGVVLTEGGRKARKVVDDLGVGLGSEPEPAVEVGEGVDLFTVRTFEPYGSHCLYWSTRFFHDFSAGPQDH